MNCFKTRSPHDHEFVTHTLAIARDLPFREDDTRASAIATLARAGRPD